MIAHIAFMGIGSAVAFVANGPRGIVKPATETALFGGLMCSLALFTYTRGSKPTEPADSAAGAPQTDPKYC